ncbi:hypothetical protein JCM19992_19770 [Thermostilla marina]
MLLSVLLGGVRTSYADSAHPPADIPDKIETLRTASIPELVSGIVDEINNAELIAPKKRAILELWKNAPPGSREELIRKSIQTAALWNPHLNTLVRDAPIAVKAAEPDGDTRREVDRLPTGVRDAIRLVLAGYCVGHRRYEWALEWLDGVQVAEVADPAAFWFYRGTAHFGLLHKAEASADLGRLLHLPENEVPVRYRLLAERMQTDLAAMKPDSLEHIARRMDDVERRLDHGEYDEQLPKIEQGIVESLDKLIEQLERQRQQQQQQAGAAGNQSRSSTQPASESRLMGASGQGRVTKREIGHEAGWGDLPPKEREKALREIAREFPPHYRKVIEEYFRRLAAESDQ